MKSRFLIMLWVLCFGDVEVGRDTLSTLNLIGKNNIR